MAKAKSGSGLKSLLHVGTDAEQLSTALPSITKAIDSILASSAGDEVKKAAIVALSAAFKVENVNVSDCAFTASNT